MNGILRGIPAAPRHGVIATVGEHPVPTAPERSRRGCLCRKANICDSLVVILVLRVGGLALGLGQDARWGSTVASRDSTESLLGPRRVGPCHPVCSVSGQTKVVTPDV